VHLKRLEIQGFKSFADKVVLEMKPGIIVVVGPNGSGKSNIADAIRWVLGEQSAKSLRGGKMEDVIFAGSDTRRSLGMAEVSLTLDNNSGYFPLEFSEITVTRRLFRSGESDYLINRVPCRLRDIHELFMDTGVGREGISIIGQGKIDEILAMKPEEKRSVLEDAAGIVKYRHRKREAVRKLEETEASLVRLNDIITELADQEESLAEQSRTATVYLDLKQELDALEIGLIINELTSTRQKMHNILSNRAAEETARDEARTKFLKAQSQEEELKLLLQQQDEKLVKQQEEVYAENLRLEKNQGEKNIILEKISELTRREEIIKKDISNNKAEQQKVQEVLNAHLSSGESLIQQLAEQKAKLKTYEVQLEEENWHDQKMAEQLEALKSEHFDALQEEAKLHNELNSQKQRISTLQRQEEQFRQKKSDLQQEKEQAENKVTELTKETARIAELRDSLQSRILEAEDKLLRQEDLLRKIRKDNEALLSQRNNLQAKYKALCDLEKEGQGYREGVRELLQLKAAEQMKGIIGTVAQVITVPKDYEIAVETALGGSLQHLLTENDKVAQQAINWLKKHNKGRVTLLPLNTVKGNRPNGDVPSGERVIGCLSDLIEHDPRYKGVIDYLLGRVWLVDNLATAVQQAKATGFRFRMVTLDGQLVNMGGSLTGGSRNINPNGILSRRRSIMEMEQSLTRLNAEVSRGEKLESEQHDILSGIKQELIQLNQQLQDLSLQAVENDKAKERWLAESERLNNELANLDLQMQELVSEREGIERSIHRYAEETELLKQRISDAAASIQEMTEKLKQVRSERIKKNEFLTQLRIEVATVAEKVASFKKEEQHYLQRLNQLKEQQAAKENELQQVADKKEELHNSYTFMESEQETQLLQLQEMERQLEILKLEKQQISENLSQASQEAKEYSSLLQVKENKLHQFDLQQSKFEMIIEAAESRLREQYNLEPAQAYEKFEAITEKKSALSRIGELKEEIGGLGQVNIAAIEEYKRLKERLCFLTTQVEDMNEAKERLREVIREMDEIMSRKFTETFRSVNQAFQEMFIRLFGGGKAQLLLTDPDNPLETGVEIIAQPPGKKTQYLSLLSGGEKALTAISLLMAILKIKPSPFCVLDEIEANLDEVNVLRFAQVLKDFAERTQFIVISHQKGTMEIANLLYGVTIEENGVSRLVSVKLEDIEKEAS